MTRVLRGLKIHTGPAFTYRYADIFDRAGITVEGIGTEHVYCTIMADSRMHAIYCVSHALEVAYGHAFGLKAEHFIPYTPLGIAWDSRVVSRSCG